MTLTVTPGVLKILEANVQGIGNKEACIKQFLQRRKKKADIFCMVEIKTTQSRKLLEQFPSGNYRIGTYYCRETGGPGGGVVMLVHERLTEVKDVAGMFKEEFEVARNKGIDIAGIKLNLKPKDCQAGVFIFGVYRRPSNKSDIKDFLYIFTALVKKVSIKYKGTAVFTGDFNIDNSKNGQNTRSKALQEKLWGFKTFGYKFTHTRPSHSLGAALNNFLVPIKMRYSNSSTLCTAFENGTLSNNQKPTKKPDHFPIQLVLSLENSTSLHLPQSNQHQGQVSNKTGNPVHKSWSEEYVRGIPTITLIDDSDDDDDDDDGSGSQDGAHSASWRNQHQPQPSNSKQDCINGFVLGTNVTLARVKIEGEPRNSGIGQQNVRHTYGNPHSSNQTAPFQNVESALARESVIFNNPTPLPGSSTSYQAFQTPHGTGGLISSISSNIQQPPVMHSSPENGRQTQINDFFNTPTFPRVFGSRVLQQMPDVHSRTENRANIPPSEDTVLTTERTYRVLQTVRPDHCARQTPYLPVEGTDGNINLEQLYKEKLKVINELIRLKTTPPKM